jgi:hypothetical protein
LWTEFGHVTCGNTDRVESILTHEDAATVDRICSAYSSRVRLSHRTNRIETSRVKDVACLFYFSSVNPNESKGNGQNLCLRFKMDLDKLVTGRLVKME